MLRFIDDSRNVTKNADMDEGLNEDRTTIRIRSRCGTGESQNAPIPPARSKARANLGGKKKKSEKNNIKDPGHRKHSETRRTRGRGFETD